MAQKSRFYNVFVRNGYGEQQYVVPAQTEAHAREYFRSSTENAYKAQHLGFFYVTLQGDPSSGIHFWATIGDYVYRYEHGDAGFEYLEFLFKKPFDSMLDEMLG
ncbi:MULTISPECIES: hypothetical protein [Pseudomonas]|uniref:hypothetical protein n=1 Tax=Pseudomonas TaxID=286 RepID=UPI000CD4C2A6|nr:MULTISPECIES: hypothetical protein [Pseudomonas]RBH54304.1 hypothetical protein C3F00_025070 [Pseudomonas sp. MWU13-2860]